MTEAKMTTIGEMKRAVKALRKAESALKSAWEIALEEDENAHVPDLDYFRSQVRGFAVNLEQRLHALGGGE